jgi:hypothetical protein
MRHIVSMNAASPDIPDDEPTSFAERSDWLRDVQPELNNDEEAP